MLSVSDQCRSCLVTLQEAISILSRPDHNDGRVKHNQICEELDRFSLFTGNIGALHRPESSMSIESRLQEANDVLTHISSLLADLNEVAIELLEIVSGKREGMISVAEETEEGNGEEISEVNELLEEISGTITRLFRVSILIRQAAPTDLFAKALSRNRYRFNDQFDIAHVGEKYRKLATKDYAWLRQRLGRAITQRRHYLSYIQDHHEKLGRMLNHHEKADSSAAMSQAPMVKQSLESELVQYTTSHPSLFTKATTIAAERITPQLLVVEESGSEDDARSYTTISRSIVGDHESSTTVRIPKLDDLRVGNKKEFECPFCFRIKKFKSERIWRKHVFSDLRPYVCTFSDCNAPYFGDINKWFQHEMTFHRVAYKCFLCPNKVYYQENKYLSHLKREHAKIVDDSGEQQSRDLARKPLAQILASDCPCCSDWADRLKERITKTSGSASNETLAVTPTVFKRHLAGHLEQLALFAVPVAAATDVDNNSNAAMEERKSKRTDASQLSTLTFASFRDGLAGAILEMEVDPPTSEGSHANTQVTEIEAEANNESTYSSSSGAIGLEDHDGADHSNTLTSMSNLAGLRLLHYDALGRLVLTNFSGRMKPPYAILSHRWTDSEILFEDIVNGTYKEKAEGYRKLQFCAERAAQDELQYFWIDTCCIDRWNIRERSEAINSMFQWYKNAIRCYVFLSDVSVSTATEPVQRSDWETLFRASAWFTRGWTLQELIAPVSVEFFSREGYPIGDKASLDQLIYEITNIPLAALRNCPLHEFSISERVKWANSRRTTEEEDIVYCLLGIFGVSMPTTYGEGQESAQHRLQAEVEAAANASSIIPFSQDYRFVG